jgi:hypothetical protein
MEFFLFIKFIEQNILQRLRSTRHSWIWLELGEQFCFLQMAEVSLMSAMAAFSIRAVIGVGCIISHFQPVSGTLGVYLGKSIY